HALESLRSALSCARYDFTALALKSIFLPCAGFVRTDVDSGSPLSWTSAELVSCVDAASSLGAAAGVPAITRPNAATAAMTRPLSICRVVRTLRFIICPPSGLQMLRGEPHAVKGRDRLLREARMNVK